MSHGFEGDFRVNIVIAREGVAVITCACLTGVGVLVGVPVAGSQDYVKETYFCNSLAR